MEGHNPDFAGVQSRKDQTIKKTVLLENINTACYYMALSHKDWELPNSRI